jgi:hypothetical protein
VFSRGRILLSHIRNRLEANTVRKIMCLGAWFNAGFVTVQNIRDAIASNPAEDSDNDGADAHAADGIEWE